MRVLSCGCGLEGNARQGQTGVAAVALVGGGGEEIHVVAQHAK